VRIQSDPLHNIDYKNVSAILVLHWNTSSKEHIMSSKVFITLENVSQAIINCLKAKLFLGLKNYFLVHV